MENYYYFVKSRYNIEPKFNFTDDIIDGVQVYNYKGSCEYNGQKFKTEILTDNKAKGRIAYCYISILLLLQLNNKISNL